MNLFKLKYVVPIGKLSFRLHVLASVAVQTGFVFVTMLVIYFFKFQFYEVSTLTYLMALCFVHLFCSFFVFDFYKYNARFKDIYPDHKLSLPIYLFAGFFPVAFIALTLFLCFKNSDEASHPNRIFKIRFAVIALCPLIAIQIVSPLVSYWTASPSTYYIVNVAHDTLDLIEFKKKVGYRNDLIEEYQRKHPGTINSTQIVLLLAVNSAVIIKEKGRAIASGTDGQEASFKYGIEVLNMCHKTLIISENNRMNLLDYSPISWLHPSGPLEIFLLSMVEQRILSKYNTVILVKSSSLLNNLEKGLLKMSPQLKEYYARKISELRQKFSKTKTFISKT